MDHAELSALALAKWALPEVVCKAARYHHNPESPDAPLLAMIVNRADGYVNHLGITIVAPVPSESDPPSIEIPGYTYDTSEALARFERDSKELSQFFQ